MVRFWVTLTAETHITMITATSSSSAAPAATVPPSVNLTPAEQEVANLRSQLELAQQKAAAERAEADRLAKEERHQKVLSLTALLGVPSLEEVVRVIEEEAGLMPRLQLAKPALAKRAFPSALSDQTKAQMRAMLEAGATSRAVSEALGVGISTTDSWKAKWGLTHRNLGGGRPAFKRAGRSRKTKSGKTGRHFSPAQKARIVAALEKPGHRVALIAKREGSSREAIYAIRRHLPQLQAA